jgi:PPOX class probable F420-dependent enzyme
MATSTSSPELHPVTLQYAREPNYAAVTTMMPDGLPQTQLVWIGTDGECLLVNTEVHRQKYLNVERDPRVTVNIRKEEDPYAYAEVRGEVVETVWGQRARDHIDELCEKYHGKPYPPDDIKTERVILRITPRRQTILSSEEVE